MPSCRPTACLFCFTTRRCNAPPRGRGPAARLDWNELSKLDAGAWHSRAFAGEPLPSLAGIARYCLRNAFALNIEIKPTPGTEAETGRVVAEHATALWRDAPVPPLLSSFQRSALEAARDAAPGLPRAQLLETLGGRWLEDALALGCVAIVTAYAQIDAEAIARVHDAGLKALVYTVNDPAEAHRLMQLGIDGIITDTVDRFSPGNTVAC